MQAKTQREAKEKQRTYERTLRPWKDEQWSRTAAIERKETAQAEVARGKGNRWNFDDDGRRNAQSTSAYLRSYETHCKDSTEQRQAKGLLTGVEKHTHEMQAVQIANVARVLQQAMAKKRTLCDKPSPLQAQVSPAGAAAVRRPPVACACPRVRL